MEVARGAPLTAQQMIGVAESILREDGQANHAWCINGAQLGQHVVSGIGYEAHVAGHRFPL